LNFSSQNGYRKKKKAFLCYVIIISEETLLLLIERVPSLSVHFTGIYGETLFKMFLKRKEKKADEVY